MNVRRRARGEIRDSGLLPTSNFGATGASGVSGLGTMSHAEGGTCVRPSNPNDEGTGGRGLSSRPPAARAIMPSWWWYLRTGPTPDWQPAARKVRNGRKAERCLALRQWTRGRAARAPIQIHKRPMFLKKLNQIKVRAASVYAKATTRQAGHHGNASHKGRRGRRGGIKVN